jgi:hypothetical protein
MQPGRGPLSLYAPPVLGALGLAAATGLAFAMWLENKAAIFMALVESGLSWCF